MLNNVSMKLNKELYICHCKLLLQVILNTNWNNSSKNEIIKLIMASNKKKRCWNSMCTRSCNTTLQTMSQGP